MTLFRVKVINMNKESQKKFSHSTPLTVRKFFDYISSMVLDFFFPPRCPICNKYLEERNEIICTECIEKTLNIVRLPDSRPPLKEIWKLTKYKEGTRDMILDLKFNRQFNKLPALEKILDEAINTEPQLLKLLSRVDIAVAVPLHIDREKKRGFNQVEKIFGEWLKRNNIPLDRLLLRTRETAHLYNLNLIERKKEIDGAFKLTEGAEPKVKGKVILIIDDIFTTGTTMSECAKALEKSGALEIYGLALASDFNIINYSS